MQLLTEEIKERLPEIGETEGDDDPTMQVKFFDPSGSWSWFGIEYDPEKEILWWVDGDFPELGYSHWTSWRKSKAG